MLKKQIANILTFTRIVLSIPLLIVKTFSLPFYILYLLCGFTDMIDGTVARKTHSESSFGQKLDSIADFIFIVVCLIKIVPCIKLDVFFGVWILIIAMIKIGNVLIGYAKHRKIILLHTVLNKITGFVLFVFPLTIPFIKLSYTIFACCLLATVAAIYEGCCIITKKF